MTVRARIGVNESESEWYVLEKVKVKENVILRVEIRVGERERGREADKQTET